MSTVRSLVPDGALAAAILATREGGWSEAIRLWRDIFRTGLHDSLAAGCIAEAAWHLGNTGIFDHMIAHCPDKEALLAALSAHDRSDSVPHKDWALGDWSTRMSEQVRMFQNDHILGHLCPEHLSDQAIAGDRRVGTLERLKAPRAKVVQEIVTEHVATKDAQALGEYGKTLIDRAAPPDALHWVILGMARLGAGSGESEFDSLRHAFATYPLRDTDRQLADARLYRGLGYPYLARLILRRALETVRRAKDRAKIRRRLAKLAAVNDRWLDDRDILTAADFDSKTEARDALLALTEPLDTGAGEPLISAFDWLLDRVVLNADRYEPEDRLLMVGNTLGCGGMERILARSYRHFSDSGQFDHVDLALLDFAEGQASAFYAGEAGVTPEDVLVLSGDGSARMPCALLPGSWKIRAQKLCDHIVATKPGVIHAWNDLTGLLAAFAGLAAGCPKIIVHFHHAPGVPQSGRAEQISSYPEIYRRLRVRPEISTIFCAEAAARGYANWWRVDQDERFRVTYNGFDWDTPTQDKGAAKIALGIAPDAPVIGTVFRFSNVKQPLLWAEAAIAFARKRPEACFLMVGDGQLQDDVARRFDSAGMTDALIMPGRVENVADYLAAMDVFWLTSKTEGLPNVLIEAQFTHVPVIAFDVGGASETFLPGASGILVEPDNLAALAEETDALLSDSTRISKMAEAGHNNAVQSFSADAFYDRLSRAYSES
ncbi:glycosyltransferase [Parasphingopyxis sp. CP4]|uniref:glycosyltransferase n=1 Tax=Parasphingopyxis sp. CP4 TaxID=2724527 RepID=UPI0015A3BCB7|nr:glycosyltransferase [Parasphingopyxis sp. CP4]QLC21326.1 glycosyltransferase [Parasphingopyxis sp. CP4]